MARPGLKGLIPFPIRLELARLRRWPRWAVEARRMARDHAVDPIEFRFTLSKHCSPLRRSEQVDATLQAGKEHNVALVARKLDAIAIPSHRTFSYHHAVGRPSRLRGFRMGVELHSGEISKGIGGGCCQVSNMLYLLAIRSGLDVLERHRHALDLFPDHGRNVPFGCGATVFYNFADLRFRNPHEVEVMIAMRVQGGFLHGEVRSREPLPFTVEVYETDHSFYREGDAWFRQNRIRRRFIAADGTIMKDEELAHNRGRCLYDPEAQD